MSWASGDTLQAGKYVIEKELGKGGLGIAYLARNKSTNEKVVLKTLKREILENLSHKPSEQEKYRKGFEDEASRLDSCKHPNIVEFKDHFEEESHLWIVMEYIDGENLWDRVKRQRELTETEALKYVTQIGNALKVVHEKNLLHRDVSPSNIIIKSNSNDAKLIDFGIARPYISDEPLTAYETTGFSPVEQCYPNRSQGPYTDVYALAATLYYLLVGDNPSSAWVRKDSENLVPPKEKNPNISDRVNQAILKGMAIEPTDRPASVQEWLKMLEPPPPPPPPPLPFSFDVVFLDVRGQEKSREQRHAELFEQILNKDPFLRLEMVKIPQGTFLMGSPDFKMVKGKSQESKLNERPRHSVSVDSFFMSKYPITQAIWKIIAKLPKVQIDLTPDCSHFQGDENNPVEKVSWYQAVEFCDRLSQLTKLNYRLPSEAEWEYACRAGIDNKPFHFGDTITTKVANYDGTESYNYEPMGEYHNKTKPVGSFGVANAFGLYDMHGNVWEWCADTKHDNYIDAPLDSRAWEVEGEADNNTSKVLRGGSWKTKARDCRAANRRFLRPSRSNASSGFRVALNQHLL